MATENKKYIPALRFPEFQNDGEWKRCKLSDVAVRKRKKNTKGIELPVYTNSATSGVISQEDYFDREIVTKENLVNYGIIEPNDFVYNPRVSVTAPVGPISRNKLSCGIMSPLYLIFGFNGGDINFFEHYFKGNSWHNYLRAKANYGARFDRINIGTKEFMDMPIPYPSLAEQKKVADCLSSLDKYIDATKCKLELLKEHKKGLMQRLFPAKGKTSPEIRFPEFIGTKEWTPKQLGFIGETFGGLSGKSAEDFGTGKPFVTYKQVFNSSEIDFSECALVQVSENEVQNSLQYGDILVTTSSETPDEVGYTAVVTNKNIPECYLNSFCFIYRLFDDESIDAKFLIYLFSNDAYRAAVVRIAQGITRFNISKTKFKEIELVIPENKNEQIKIAETLSSVDKQIAEYDKKIKALELHKKGLMQQLFPKL